MEITVNDLNGQQGIVLSTHENEEATFLCIHHDQYADYHVEVAIDGLW